MTHDTRGATSHPLHICPKNLPFHVHHCSSRKFYPLPDHCGLSCFLCSCRCNLPAHCPGFPQSAEPGCLSPHTTLMVQPVTKASSSCWAKDDRTHHGALGASLANCDRVDVDHWRPQGDALQLIWHHVQEVKARAIDARVQHRRTGAHRWKQREAGVARAVMERHCVSLCHSYWDLV
jgi:hypothetical protein